MKGKGKIGFLDDSLQAPKTNDLAYEAWDHENSMALSWLINSVDLDIARLFSTYPLENCGWLIWRPIRIWEMQLNCMILNDKHMRQMVEIQQQHTII